MKTKEPSSASLLAARIARAYPSLSAYSAATLAESLCAIERMQRRHAERCCSGEDGGYVRKRDFAKIAVFDGKEPRGTTEWRKDANGRWIVEHDPDAEARAEKRIDLAVDEWKRRLVTLLDVPRNEAEAAWCSAAIQLQGDPRGPVLLLRLPGETEASGV